MDDEATTVGTAAEDEAAAEAAAIRVLVHHSDPEPLVELIRGRFPEAEVAACASYAGLAEAVAAAEPEAVLGYRFEPGPYPREALVDTGPVAWVHVGGVACDHLAPWDPARLTVTNSSGIQAEVIAEYALGAVFALNLKLHRFVRAQAERRWAPEPLAQSAGKTMLVVGLGRLGRAIAARAQAHGMEVIGVGAKGQPVAEIEGVFVLDDLRHALALADYVVLFLPLTGRTRGMIDDLALTTMKRGAFLINMAHGEVVDEAALVAALEGGQLGGAVLDAFATEPLPPDSPLWGLDNVIVTPRATTLFEGWERACAELFCDNLERRLAGEPLLNVVEPDAAR